MNLNSNGIGLIKICEGCKLEAYKDLVGVVTIGYGATGPNIKMGDVWTQEQADSDLIARLAALCVELKKMITVDLIDNEFSAVVSLSYNIGVTAFKNSTMLKLINQGALNEAAEEFLKWDHAGGKEVAGLYKRRLAERKLFNSLA